MYACIWSIEIRSTNVLEQTIQHPSIQHCITTLNESRILIPQILTTEDEDTTDPWLLCFLTISKKHEYGYEQFDAKLDYH
ncbi:hypothetical protein Hanom_Chr13g01232621 [Helianthus anomalus]